MAEKASVKLNCYKCNYGLELIASFILKDYRSGFILKYAVMCKCKDYLLYCCIYSFVINDWTAKMKELSGKEISVSVGSTDWHSGWN